MLRKRSYRVRKMLAGMLAALSLCGCASSGSGLDTYAPPEDKRLVVYTSHKEDVYRPIVREFEQRTGIWVEVITGGTNELLERIRLESEEPAADVMFGGGVESAAAYSSCFEAFRCAEYGQIDSRYQADLDYWTPFSALPVVLIYNTKLVEPGKVTRWKDLGRPEFRGEIAFADPAVSGSSFTALVTCMTAMDGTSLEWMVDALEYQQLNGSGEIVKAVADGTCLVGITLEETALRQLEEGANLAIVYPADGTSCVPDGTAIVRGAPHKENAELFVEFTMGVDVQQNLGSRFHRRSIREDIPLGEGYVPLEELTLVPYPADWVVRNREWLLVQWQKYMEEGKK